VLTPPRRQRKLERWRLPPGFPPRPRRRRLLLFPPRLRRLLRLLCPRLSPL